MCELFWSASNLRQSISRTQKLHVYTRYPKMPDMLKSGRKDIIHNQPKMPYFCPFMEEVGQEELKLFA